MVQGGPSQVPPLDRQVPVDTTLGLAVLARILNYRGDVCRGLF